LSEFVYVYKRQVANSARLKSHKLHFSVTIVAQNDAQ